MKKASEKIMAGILGSYGSFHHQAANAFFSGSKTTIISYETFLELFVAIKNRQVAYAVVAVENTISGGLLLNYALLLYAGVHIAGELWLPVKQNLITLPGVSPDDITEIHTHPMALLQCHAFLEPLIARGVKIVEVSNTALSVKYIYDTDARHIAAIGSIAAASLYRLDVASENIQTNMTNYTRFLLLSATAEEMPVASNGGQNKATIYCSVSNNYKSLPHFLGLCSRDDCRVSNIVALSSPDAEKTQQFVIDIVYDNHHVLEHILRVAAVYHYEIRVLGRYLRQEMIKTVKQHLPIPENSEL